MPLLSGSCLCGAVKYSCDVTREQAQRTSACHCRACRKISGATTSLNLAFQLAQFKLLSGTLKTVTTKHVDEGFEFSVIFCEGCGSPIYASPAGGGPSFIQVGTLDDAGPLEVVPAVELNIKHRLPWIKPIEGSKQNQTYTT